MSLTCPHVYRLRSVAGIVLGDLWDKSVAKGAVGSGLYAANKQAKPAAARLDRLWKEEWNTKVTKPMTSEGVVEFDGYYGEYTYELASADGKTCAEFRSTDAAYNLPESRIISRVGVHAFRCSGTIELLAREDDALAPKGEWGARGAAAEAQTLVVRCDWEGHVHIPVWTTPAVLALIAVGCLIACWRQGTKIQAKKSTRQLGRHMPLRSSCAPN